MISKVDWNFAPELVSDISNCCVHYFVLKCLSSCCHQRIPQDLAAECRYDEVVAYLMQAADLNMLGVSTWDCTVEDSCGIEWRSTRHIIDIDICSTCGSSTHEWIIIELALVTGDYLNAWSGWSWIALGARLKFRWGLGTCFFHSVEVFTREKLNRPWGARILWCVDWRVDRQQTNNVGIDHDFSRLSGIVICQC